MSKDSRGRFRFARLRPSLPMGMALAAPWALAALSAAAADVQVHVQPKMVWNTYGNRQFETYDEACQYSIDAIPNKDDLRNIRCENNRPPAWMVNGLMPGVVKFEWISDGKTGWTNQFGGKAICPEGMTQTLLDRNTDDLTLTFGCSFDTKLKQTSCDRCETKEYGNPISVAGDQKVEYAQDLPPLAGGMSISRVMRSGSGGFAWQWVQSRVLSSNAAGATPPGSEWCFPASGTYDSGSKPFLACLPVIGFEKHFAAESVLVQSGSDAPKELEVKPGGTRTFDRSREFWKAVGIDGIESYFLLEGQLMQRYSANGRLMSVTQPNGQQTNISYVGQSDRIDLATDTFGRSYSFRYDDYGALSAVSDSMGGVTYGYSATVPAGCPASYSECRTLETVTFADNKSKRYVYNESPNAPLIQYRSFLTSKWDEGGSKEAAFFYDAQGRPVSTEKSGGVDKYEIVYPPTGDLREVHTPQGGVQTVNIQSFGGYRLVASQSSPAGSGCDASMSWRSYDSRGNAVSEIDFNGSRTCSAFAGVRNVETIRVEGLRVEDWPKERNCPDLATYQVPQNLSSDKPQRKITTQWHPSWRLEARRAEPKRIVTTVYNGEADPLNNNAVASCAAGDPRLPDNSRIAVVCMRYEQSTDDDTGNLGFTAPVKETRKFSYTYNQFGQVLTETDPRGKVTNFEYWTDTSFTGSGSAARGHQFGDLKSMTNPLQQKTEYLEYNKRGQVLTTRFANASQEQREYHVRGWLSKVKQVPNDDMPSQVTQYEYFDTGLPKKVTQPDGSFAKYTWDDAHRLTDVTDSMGNKVHYELDSAGNRKAEKFMDPQGALAKTIRRTFDALGRMQSMSGVQ